MASYCVCMRFALDLSNVVRTDTAEGVRYSGTYTLDGVTKLAEGESGSAWNWVDGIVQAIAAECEKEWGETPDAEDILDAVERTEVAAIAVHRIGKRFQVVVEDVF